MEVKIYQMIYIKKIRETILDKLSDKLRIYQPKLFNEIKSSNIRILGHDFVKNNINKNILIINNKKNQLKEFINDREFKGDEIKIKIILIKELYHLAHIFENCSKLKKIELYNNIINIPDGECQEFKENNDYSPVYYEDNNDYTEDTLRNDDTKSHSNSNKNKEDEIYINPTITDIKNNIIDFQYNHYYDMSKILYNCLSLSSLPDISKWNTINVNNMSEMFSNCLSLLNFFNNLDNKSQIIESDLSISFRESEENEINDDESEENEISDKKT